MALNRHSRKKGISIESSRKMRLKAITEIVLTALLVGTLTSALDILQAEPLKRPVTGWTSSGVASVIFASGFETGDYSEWTGIATEGGAAIALVSDISHHGSYSSRATFTAPWQGAWSEISGLSANPIYVRWYARFDTLPGNDQAFTLIESIDSNGDSIWDLDIHRSAGGTLGLWFYRTRPSIGDHYYSYNFKVNTWYCFEVKFYLHASAGEYRVYLNGVEVITLTGLDTSRSAWMGIKLGRGSGFLSSLTTWADCVKVADSYIGPEAAPVGGVWVPIDKLGLLAPYIGVATIILAIVATGVFVKYKNKK